MDIEAKHVATADPKRPYKTYAAMLSAFISSLLLSGVEMPMWLKAVLGGIVAGLAVYLTGNPLKFKQNVTIDKPAGFNVDDDVPLF